MAVRQRSTALSFYHQCWKIKLAASLKMKDLLYSCLFFTHLPLEVGCLDIRKPFVLVSLFSGWPFELRDILYIAVNAVHEGGCINVGTEIRPSLQQDTLLDLLQSELLTAAFSNNVLRRVRWHCPATSPDSGALRTGSVAFEAVTNMSLAWLWE